MTTHEDLAATIALDKHAPDSPLAVCHAAKRLLLDLEKAMEVLTQEDPDRLIAIDIDALEERLEESRWRSLPNSTPQLSNAAHCLGIRA